MGIGTEVLTVLEVFNNLNILKVERGVTGLSHTASTTVFFKPDTLTIKSNLEFFDSRVNDKVYFNPVESVGVGTTAGISNSVSFSFGNSVVTRDIPTRSITLENHPFKNNQRVVFNNGGGSNISISTSPTGSALIYQQMFLLLTKILIQLALKLHYHHLKFILEIMDLIMTNTSLNLILIKLKEIFRKRYSSINIHLP